MTYRIASTTTRRRCPSGRPPAAVWQAGTGSSGPISAHSPSVASEGYKRERRQHKRAHAHAGATRQTGTRAPGEAGWFRHPCHYQEPRSHSSQTGSRHPKITTRPAPPHLGSETGTKVFLPGAGRPQAGYTFHVTNGGDDGVEPAAVARQEHGARLS